MPPKSKRILRCEVCLDQNFKYTCPQCQIVYCSLVCYKRHKESTCVSERDHGNDASTNSNVESAESSNTAEDAKLTDPVILRPLTSLKWPYVPEESAFPDPLKRDDPKVLNLSQYEAIATSPSIRKILTEHKNLPDLLTSIDKLRGREREDALQRALGVTAPEVDDQLRRPELREDVLALRELAEAIEASVRGKDETALGLNWGD